jgi:hypothetical protein
MLKLFKFQTFGSPALTSITCASDVEPEALMALVRLFEEVSGFGLSRASAKLGHGPDLHEVRLSARQAALATALLECSDIEDRLRSAISVVRQEKLASAEKECETQRVHHLSGFEFGKLLEARSGGRLLQRMYEPMCVLSCPKLLPVTHFKALVSLTTYERIARTFTLTAKGDTPVVRDKLLQLAAKISRSTKQVTQADIARRRAERRVKVDLQAMSWDEVELMVEDTEGFVTKENLIEMALKLGVWPSGNFPRWVSLE